MQYSLKSVNPTPTSTTMKDLLIAEAGMLEAYSELQRLTNITDEYSQVVSNCVSAIEAFKQFGVNKITLDIFNDKDALFDAMGVTFTALESLEASKLQSKIVTGLEANLSDLLVNFKEFLNKIWLGLVCFLGKVAEFFGLKKSKRQKELEELERKTDEEWRKLYEESERLAGFGSFCSGMKTCHKCIDEIEKMHVKNEQDIRELDEQIDALIEQLGLIDIDKESGSTSTITKQKIKEAIDIEIDTFDAIEKMSPKELDAEIDRMIAQLEGRGGKPDNALTGLVSKYTKVNKEVCVKVRDLSKYNDYVIDVVLDDKSNSKRE